MAIVYLVAVGPNGYPSGTSNITEFGSVIVEVTPAMSPDDMIAQLFMRLPDREPIHKLRLASHGNSGRLFMGRDSLHQGNVGSFSYCRPRFARSRDGVGVTIYGCAVASAVEIRAGGTTMTGGEGMPSSGAAVPNSGWCGPGSSTSMQLGCLRTGAGYRFLHALARATNVGVKAAIFAQDTNVSSNHWDLQGATMTVLPNGQGRLTDPHRNIGIDALSAERAGYVVF